MELPPTDFESAASASSAIPALTWAEASVSHSLESLVISIPLQSWLRVPFRPPISDPVLIEHPGFHRLPHAHCRVVPCDNRT